MPRSILEIYLQRLMKPEDGGGSGGGGAEGGAGGTGGEAGRLAAAAAAAAAAAGGAGGGGGSGGAGAEGGAAAGTPYRPQGIPEHLAGASDKETIDKLFGAYEPLRTEMAKRAIPKDPKEYTFKPAEKLAAYFSKEDDPALAQARVAAHKHGIPQAAFEGFINDTFGPLVENGTIGALFDPNAELTQLGQLLGSEAAPADKQAVSAALVEAEGFATGLASQLKLPDVAKGALMALADTAAGTVALRAIKSAFAERGLQVGGTPAAGGVRTKEQLQALAGDPRLDPKAHGKFDPKFREEFDADWKRAFGG